MRFLSNELRRIRSIDEQHYQVIFLERCRVIYPLFVAKNSQIEYKLSCCKFVYLQADSLCVIGYL